MFPNCGTVYFEGKIIGAAGAGDDGRTVRLRFANIVDYKKSGVGENPGGWGFSPLAPGRCHAPFTFLVDIVASETNPTPQSDTLTILFTGCDNGGQHENIVFEYAR